ncbi:MAG: hypothetical protein JJT94_13630 [Bernardetiaceae bacterium]|nr:hypothetical protein [Bernardetiaceae bacterium]
MTQIVSNDFYEIAYHSSKNRFYLRIKGFWKSEAQDVPNYLADWQRAVAMARPHFTLLTDLREAKTAPQEINELHQAAQQILVKAKVLIVAELIDENAFVEYQAEHWSRHSGMPRTKFKNPEEAEAFLDEQVAKAGK